MARTIFLSILGNTNYEETSYYFENNRDIYVKTRFVQRAVIGYYTNKGVIFDEIIIFLTQEAREKNWENNNFDRPMGLKAEIESLNLPAKISTIDYGNQCQIRGTERYF